MTKLAVLSACPAAGKTTTAVGLASCLGSIGARVLVVDCDPHRDAALALRTAVTLHHYQIQQYGLPHEMILAATARTGVEALTPVETLTRSGVGERGLCDLVEPLEKGYGYVFFDCPPGLDAMPICALTASEVAIITVPAETESLHELPAFIDEIDAFRKSSGTRLRLMILFTVHDGSREAAGVVAELRRRYPRLCLNTVIPTDEQLHGVLEGRSMLDLDGRGAKAYSGLALELAARAAHLGAA